MGFLLNTMKTVGFIAFLYKHIKLNNNLSSLEMMTEKFY